MEAQAAGATKRRERVPRLPVRKAVEDDDVNGPVAHDEKPSCDNDKEAAVATT